MTTQDIKPGYKQSPLGPIPDNWEIKSLKEIGNFFRGHSYDATNVCDNGLLVIRSSNIQNNGIDIENDLQFVNNECNKNILLQKNDIVICMANGSRELVGKTGKYLGNYTGKITVGAFCAIFRGGNNFSRFIFNSPLYKKYMHFLLAGTNINNLKITDLEKIEIPLPPLPEQEAIAKILGKVDETIEKTQSMIEKLELRNKGLQNQLLKNDNRKSYKLGECLKFTPRPVKKPESNFFALGVRSHGKGIFHKNDFDPEDIAIDTLYEVKENDLVVNITFAWEQAIAIANKCDDGGLVSHRFPTYTFKTDTAIPEYFRYLILQKRIKYMLDLISPGGAGRNRVLSKTDFLKLEVKLPNVEEQKKIASILDKATEQLNLYKQKLEKLQELKKGLMQQLLTGKVRVKEFRN